VPSSTSYINNQSTSKKKAKALLTKKTKEKLARSTILQVTAWCEGRGIQDMHSLLFLARSQRASLALSIDEKRGWWRSW